MIYGVHEQQRNFLVEVKAILSRLADTYVILRENLPLDVQRPGQPLSRESATLHLLLHQVSRAHYLNTLGSSLVSSVLY